MSMTRHIGRMVNTGSRLVVVFRKIDDDPKNCLVCEVERLPDLFQSNFMEIVNSQMAQATVNLYEALSRSVLSDGSNALNTLHQKGFLRKVPVDMVEVLPMAGRPVSLTEINKAIDGESSETPVTAETSAEPAAPAKEETATSEEVKDPTDEQKMIAQNLVVQATQMKQDAENKLKEAYRLNPELKPKPSTRKTTAKKETATKRKSTTKASQKAE